MTKERFLKYISFETTSCEESPICPSTPCQLKLAEYLVKEMKSMGIKNAKMSAKGYVYGSIPANVKGAPAIGLIAHMDTSPSASGKNVKPQIVEYKGGDIPLGNGIITKAKDFPILKKYKGHTLIVTSGDTLLGSDDKAGITEIMCAAEYLLKHPEIKHGKVCIGFTPDEEIGRGADFFDIKKFGADFAYTIDGATLGEIEYESFNAAGVKITFHGVNVHPGYAKGIMKNSLLMANDFINLLPPKESPAHTEGYEGYYHVQSLNGDETKTVLSMLIRDHDRKIFEKRKKFVENCCKQINKKYGKGSAALDMHDSYYNMKDALKPYMFVVERARKAMENAGIQPVDKAIRGGTDGCRLSFEGLPCPNLSTGGENFHGVHEFVSINDMEKMVEVIVNLLSEQ